MRKYYAKKGSIPKPGEVWLPVGDKAHLMMIHLIDIERVKAFVPEELTITTVLPGKTLGLVFMTSMDLNQPCYITNLLLLLHL